MAPLLEGQRALTGEETSGVSLLVEHFSCATIVPRLSRERCRRVACIKIGDCGPSSLDKSMDKDGKWNLWKWYMSSIWLLLFAALQKSIHVHGLKVSLDKSLYIFICGIFIIEYIYIYIIIRKIHYENLEEIVVIYSSILKYWIMIIKNFLNFSNWK